MTLAEHLAEVLREAMGHPEFQHLDVRPRRAIVAACNELQGEGK
jgi:hypothetical protein